MWSSVFLLIFFSAQTRSASHGVFDLSHELNNDTIYWPDGNPFQFYIKHRGPIMNGTVEDTGENFWYEANEFATAEHCGTHLDAPAHFAQNRWRVNEIPPERFVGPVSVVDLRESVKDDADYQITINDLVQWETVHGRELDPLIILWTGWATRWPNRQTYLGTLSSDTSLLRFPGLGRDAAQWLVNHRTVHGVGIDTASIDYGRSRLFYAHRILTKNNVFFIENLNTKDLNLEGVNHPFLVVPPLKISTGSGSPVRPLLFTADPFGAKSRENSRERHDL